MTGNKEYYSLGETTLIFTNNISLKHTYSNTFKYLISPEEQKNIFQHSVGISDFGNLPKNNLTNLETIAKAKHTQNKYYEDIIAKEYSLFIYTHKEPYIKINPYGTNPLVALAKFTTDKPAEISITVQQDNFEKISHTFEGFKKEHTISIFALVFDTINEVTITAKYEDGTIENTTVKIEVLTTPEGAKRTINENYQVFFYPLIKKDSLNRFYYLFNGTIYDEYGNLRFSFYDCTDELKTFFTYIFKDKLFVEKGNVIFAYNTLGKFLDFYPVPDEFELLCKHGMELLPNGNLLLSASSENAIVRFGNSEANTEHDFLLEIDKATKKVIRQWDLTNLSSIDRCRIQFDRINMEHKTVWGHINSIQYDSSDNSILISLKYYSVMKIDYTSGEVKWLMGPKVGYARSGRTSQGKALWDKVLTAVNLANLPFDDKIQKGYEISKDFKWPERTHDAKIFSGNLLSVFDNGLSSINDPQVLRTSESRAVIYELDEDNKTIKQIWSLNTQFSYSSSGVIFNQKYQDVIIMVSQARKNMSFYAELNRYDFKSKELLFRAIITPDIYAYTPVEITFYESLCVTDCTL